MTKWGEFNGLPIFSLQFSFLYGKIRIRRRKGECIVKKLVGFLLILAMMLPMFCAVSATREDVEDCTYSDQQPQELVVTFGDITNTNAPSWFARLGDVDNNKKIDAKDALQVLKYSVNKVEFTLEEKQAAEVTGDGMINAKDALEILKYAVKKGHRFPIEELWENGQLPL